VRLKFQLHRVNIFVLFVFVGFVNSGLNTNAIVQWWGVAGRGRVWVGSAGAEPASADGEFLGILRAST